MERDIKGWLEELGLGKYLSRFSENEIEFEVLADLTDDDLRSLEIPLGPRKKLLKAIAALAARPRSAGDSGRHHGSSPEGRDKGERRQLTVMFCDLVDSTALSARIDPEDLREIIRAYHDACASVVERFGGYVAKYLGDGVLVYFGYPQAHENDAERAARSGLAVVEAVAALSAGNSDARASPLAVRVGIDTGPVVVGDIVGEGAAEEASVVGGTPNVAARLQALARRNEVVAGPLTRELIGEAFACDDLGAHDLKGLPAPLRAWRIVRERELRGDHWDRASSDAARLVGRREELGLLARAWESSRRGNGHVVLIQGEPGIGKSRLLDALRVQAESGEHVWIATRCSPYHANSSLHPVIDHLKRVMGWSSDDSADQRLAKLESALRTQSLPLERTVPLYAALLALPLPDDRYPPLRLTAEEQRAQTLDALASWLVEEAERKPVLRVWEDLHWADSTTLELLGMCIEQAPTVAMLTVVTYRPEFVPPWPMRSHMTPITLNRLDRGDVGALITQVAGGKPMPMEVAEHIAEKADGVPLYVEELTKAVLDAGFVCEHDGHYQLARPLSDVAIPATLQDLLMARLDRVPTIREVAQLGSIFGREFAYEMLQAIASLGEAELQDRLDRLVDAELLYQRGRRPRARYIFKHALVQDAAYQSLLRRTRQYYHRQVAELLESRYPEVVRTQPELLAHHYACAEDDKKTIHYLTQCAENAAALHAHAEAIAALEQARGRAERVAPADRDRLGLTLAIREAQSLHFAGRHQQIVDVLLAQGDRLARLDEPGVAGEFYFWLGFAHAWLGHRAEAAENLRRGLEKASAAGDNAVMGRIHRALATECVYSGRPLDEAIAHARESAALLERTRDTFWLAQALFTLAYCRIFAGDFEGAQRVAEQLDLVADAAGNVRAQTNAAMITGLARTMRGEGKAGIERCERALRISPDRFETAFVLACLGRACAEAGDRVRAVAVLQEAVDLADQVRSLQFRAWFRTMLGEACLLNGEFAKAKLVVGVALEASTKAGFLLGIGLSKQVIGRIASAEGDREAAARNLGEAIDIFAGIGARFELARARMERAQLGCADDGGKMARTDVREARQAFAALGMPMYVERIERLGEHLGMSAT